MAPLAERRDVLSAADYLILFQNLDELLKISEEIRDEGGGVDSYLCRVPRITAAYRRYLSGLQRACCLLVALRRNTAFAKLVCEPAVPQKRRPDLTGVLLLPLEHYRYASGQRFSNVLPLARAIGLLIYRCRRPSLDNPSFLLHSRGLDASVLVAAAISPDSRRLPSLAISFTRDHVKLRTAASGDSDSRIASHRGFPF